MSAGSPERLLYQSFPRGLTTAVDREEQCRAGMEVLQFMLEFGLLLTAEDKVIEPHPASQLEKPVPTEIAQIRSCFTAMSRSEIFLPNRQGRTHCEKYGPFVVGLEAEATLRLGMMPTVYVPVRHRKRERGDLLRVTEGELGNDMLCSLADIRRLLIAVAEIEAHAHGPHSEEYLSIRRLRENKLQLPKGDRAIPALDKVDLPGAKAAFALLDTDRPPAFVLAEFVEILLSNYQQVDSYDDHSMASYDEREWRIVSTTSKGLDCFRFAREAQEFTPPQVRHVLGRARDAIERTSRRLGNNRKIDIQNCALLIGSNGRRFFDYVQEIIVPGAWAGPVDLVLRKTARQIFEPTLSDDAAGHAVFVRRDRLR